MIFSLSQILLTFLPMLSLSKQKQNKKRKEKVTLQLNSANLAEFVSPSFMSCRLVSFDTSQPT